MPCATVVDQAMLMDMGVGMDVTELASLAANTVVAAAVTDAFEGVRDRVARLFGRGKPDPATERRLEAMRAELSTVTSTDAASVEAAQQVQWRVRFSDLCETYPEAANELEQLITELRTQLPAHGNVTNVISGGEQHGPILMGRDFSGVIFHPDQGSAGQSLRFTPHGRVSCHRSRAPWGRGSSRQQHR